MSSQHPFKKKKNVFHNMLLRYTRDLKNLRAFRKHFLYISDRGWRKHVAVTLYDIFINMA